MGGPWVCWLISKVRATAWSLWNPEGPPGWSVAGRLCRPWPGDQFDAFARPRAGAVLCVSVCVCGQRGGRMLRCLADILPQYRCHCRVLLLGRFGPPKRKRKESAGPTRPTEPTSEEDLDLGEATAWNRVARWGRWRLTWCQSAMSRVVGWILGRLGSSWP